jgi:hypothetical protein
MPHSIFKPKGPTKASRPDAGGAALRTVPVLGVVKDTIDTIRCGRIRVYIADQSGRDPNDSTTWSTVNYMSPFYGATGGSGAKDNYGTYMENPSSYGMWNAPPDIGTTVICIFINGDPDYGYWIGCVPEPESLFMVPAIGSAETVIVNENEGNSYGGATKLPVSNINTNNSKIDNSPRFYNEPKPVHSYVAGVLAQQGLIRDTIRGTIGSSAQRESPSRVGWGVNTPGRPIYEGGYTDETIASEAEFGKNLAGLKVISRRAGHSIVMDDGDLIGRDQLIRLRTSLGHQILMSDDGQTLFIIHANGQSYIELGKEGTIDMYATNSVNIRTQGDLNLHADNNININAKKDLNLYGETVNIQSDKSTEVKVGTNYATQVQGTYTAKVDGKMSLKSAGEASLASSASTYINGSKVNLNSGESSLVPAAVKPFTTVAHTDTLFDKSKGWAAAPAALLSIVSRAPAHAPWASANQGVDVKVNNDADANFPSNPSPTIVAANNATPATPTNPVSPAIASTVPIAGAVSQALPPNVTASMVGQIATDAQSNPLIKAAIATGAGVVTQAGEKIAVIGPMAQSLKSLADAGVIKPGYDALGDFLIQKGLTVQQALPAAAFTGLPGATNLSTYLNNTAAQVQTQVATFQIAQTQATKAGLMSGSESSGQVAGIVNSVATAGLTATVNAVKVASGALGGAISGSISGPAGAAVNKLLGSATSALTSGNFAANMATTLTGGLNSITSSLNGLAQSLSGGAESLLNSAKGIAGSAFAAITKSFPKLQAGIPQNLKQIAEKAVLAAQNSGAETTAGAVAGALSSATSILPNSISTGLSALPGAQKAVSTIVNSATGALNAVPGTAQATAAISQITASITSGGALGNIASGLLDKLKAPGASLAALASAGLPAGAAAALNSAIASLSSGGALQVKLPIIGTKTIDRGTIDNLTASVFGNSKITLPNFSGNPATTGETPATTGVASILAKSAARSDAANAVLKAVDAADAARIAYQKALQSLPAGDPQLAVLRQTWDEKLKLLDAAQQAALKLVE